jgi:ribosomal protein S14
MDADHATRVQLTARLRTAQEAFNAALFAATQAGLRASSWQATPSKVCPCASTRSCSMAQTGSTNHNAKLSDDDVRAIRVGYRAYQTNRPRALARRFGISRAQLDKIVARKNWAHLPEEVA